MSQRLIQSDTLRRIRNRFENILHLVGPIPVSPCRPPTRSVSHPPVPYPSPITLVLLRTGVSFKLADLMSSAYLRSALVLRRDCEVHIQRLSRIWIERLADNQDLATQLGSIYSIFVSQYRQSLNNIVDRILEIVPSKLRLLQPKKEKRHSFNKSVIPILESFYVRNPFPSPEDKRQLTHQTGLTLEQTRIWFQNRRARARRSGQTPTRKNTQDNFVTCQPSSIPSELESEINRLIDDENQTFNCLEPDVTLDEDGNSSISGTVLWPLEAPEHAFPSTYPPICENDPFPVKDGFANFDIPWIREACQTEPAVSRTIPDVSDLAETLAKLTITDGDRSKSHKSPILHGSNGGALISTMWIPAKSATVSPALTSVTTSGTERSSLKRKPSARSSLRETYVFRASVSKDISPRTKPYPCSKPQPSLPRRIPQSKPQLISCRRPLSRSYWSRSSSTSSSVSDDSSSPYASSSDSELGTPPPISTDLSIYFPEQESPSSYIPPISLPKLSKALSQCPNVPRTYTFRTTIAPL